MTKRLISILMAIFMITAIAVPVANAAGDNTLDTTKKVSITMNCDKAGYEFEVFKIADLVTATNPYTVKYDVKVDDAAVKAAVADGNFEEADRGKILSALDKDSALNGATSVGKYSVDTDGNTKTMSDLAQGIYYVRAVNFPAGVKAVTNSCFALPYYSENGWTFAIDAINLAAKVEDEQPEIHKIITNSTRGNENFSDVSIGDTVDFKITTSVLGVVDDIPEHEFKLNSYVITDLMSKGLTLNRNSFVVTLVDADDKTLATLDPKDYTVNVTAEEGKDTNFTVSLNKEYLQKDDFYAAENVVTTYSAVLNKYATTKITGNPNEAVELKYTNKNDVEGKVEGNTVYVYTFKVQVNKVDEKGNPLSGADFSVYKTEADAKDEKNALASGTSDNDGVVVFRNADNAEMLLESGTYYVKETKAPSGFNKYTDVIPVEIKVTYGDTLTNGTYIVSAPELGLTSVDVKNSKTVLPQTGGNGNIIAYSIAFILLAAGGTVFFISRRKKKSRDKAA